MTLGPWRSSAFIAPPKGSTLLQLFALILPWTRGRPTSILSMFSETDAGFRPEFGLEHLQWSFSSRFIRRLWHLILYLQPVSVHTPLPSSAANSLPSWRDERVFAHHWATRVSIPLYRLHVKLSSQRSNLLHGNLVREAAADSTCAMAWKRTSKTSR